MSLWKKPGKKLLTKKKEKTYEMHKLLNAQKFEKQRERFTS